MATARCESCGTATSVTASMTGRPLCQKCSNMVVGAAAGMILGGADHGVEQAVVTGIAARNFTGAADADLAYQRQLAEKVKNADGFWRKMKLRIIG